MNVLISPLARASIRLAWLVALVGFLPAPAALAQLAGSADGIVLKPERLTARSWFFQGDSGMASAQNKGYMSNAGFVVTDEGVVVFDALGTPALGEAMLAAIRNVTAKADPPRHRLALPCRPCLRTAGTEGCGRAKSGRTGGPSSTSRPGLPPSASSSASATCSRGWTSSTRIVRPDVWLEGDTDFRLGGVTFRVLYSGGAHAPEDLLMFVVEERVLFAGDLLFAGRVPFVGNADSRGWLRAMDAIIPLKPSVVVPGHGPASRDVERDLVLTRDYLAYLRRTMGRAVADLDSFDDAYAKTDWSRFKALPAFEPANRINAYGTYLLMEQEALKERKP